jgi:hypothetical protein
MLQRTLMVALVVGSLLHVAPQLKAQEPMDRAIKGKLPKTDDRAGVLYADKDVQGLVDFDINKESKGKGALLVPYLNLVPSGKTASRRDVFEALGIDESRVKDFRFERASKTCYFLRWQISPSYDIFCMAGLIGSPQRSKLEDPNLALYGVRLITRDDAKLDQQK